MFLYLSQTNVLHNDLKKDAINEFGIKYWTSNPVWVEFQEHGAPFMWILKKKYDYWWKKCRLEKTYRVTKTSLFDRNWTISLKPRRRSRPLRLVWWALAPWVKFYQFLNFQNALDSPWNKIRMKIDTKNFFGILISTRLLLSLVLYLEEEETKLKILFKIIKEKYSTTNNSICNFYLLSLPFHTVHKYISWS